MWATLWIRNSHTHSLTYAHISTFRELWSPAVLYSAVRSCMVPYGPVWCRMVPHGHTWSHMVLHGPLWSRMVPHDHTWSHMVPHGPTWSHKAPHGPPLAGIAPHGLARPHMALHSPVWPLMLLYNPVWHIPRTEAYFGCIWSKFKDDIFMQRQIHWQCKHSAEHILYSVCLGDALTTAAVRPFLF